MPASTSPILKIHGFICLGILVCCTVCCTLRASLRGTARSSRSIKIIQWSGRRSPLREHDSLPVRGRQLLDVRVAEKAYSTARSNWCRCSYRGTAGVHQQAGSERSELFADAKGRIDRNHVHGQRPNNGPSRPWSGAAGCIQHEWRLRSPRSRRGPYAERARHKRQTDVGRG